MDPRDLFPNGFTPENPHLACLCDHLDGWQFGEEGLLEAVIAAVGSPAGCLIEYGAGDGDKLPLTLDRLYQKSLAMVERKFDFILVENDLKSRESLKPKYPLAEAVETLSWGHFSRHAVTAVIIDIDGQDSLVMRDMLSAGVRPVVLMVEHFDRNYPVASTSSMPLPEWALGLELNQGYKLQDSAEVLYRIAHQAGYERIGMTRCNSLFVRRDRYPALLREIGSK